MNPEEKLLTLEEVNAAFDANGTEIRKWANKRGFSEANVRKVLEGRSKCSRGQCHQIAVVLKLKEGTNIPIDEFFPS